MKKQIMFGLLAILTIGIAGQGLTQDVFAEHVTHEVSHEVSGEVSHTDKHGHSNIMSHDADTRNHYDTYHSGYNDRSAAVAGAFTVGLVVVLIVLLLIIIIVCACNRCD